MDIGDIEQVNFGFEFWTPARIAQPRLVLGYEARVRGKLFALKSEVYSPGPFDTLDDVEAVVTDRLAALITELREAGPD